MQSPKKDSFNVLHCFLWCMRVGPKWTWQIKWKFLNALVKEKRWEWAQPCKAEKRRKLLLVTAASLVTWKASSIVSVKKEDSENDSTVKICNFVIKYWAISNRPSVILQLLCWSSCRSMWFRSTDNSSLTNQVMTMQKEFAQSTAECTMESTAGVTAAMSGQPP